MFICSILSLDKIFKMNEGKFNEICPLAYRLGSLYLYSLLRRRMHSESLHQLNAIVYWLIEILQYQSL